MDHLLVQKQPGVFWDQMSQTQPLVVISTQIFGFSKGITEEIGAYSNKSNRDA